MLNEQQLQELMGTKASVVDADGERIGKLEQVFLDDRTNQPDWATVSTGLFGSAVSFVPLRGARVIADELEVQYSKDIIKHAPRLDAGEHLAAGQEDELDTYYGLAAGAGSDPGGRGVPGEPDVSAATGPARLATDKESTVGIVRTHPDTDTDADQTRRPRRSWLRKYTGQEGNTDPHDDDDGGRRS